MTTTYIISVLTKQLPHYYSWRLYLKEVTDAFTQNWGQARGLSVPLSQIKQHHDRVLLVVIPALVPTYS